MQIVPVWLGGSILVFFISDYTSQNTFMIKADVSALVQALSMRTCLKKDGTLADPSLS